MKKTILIPVVILFFVLMACNNAADTQSSAADTTAKTGAVKKDPVVIANYAGVTPCADCEGIEVSVTLKDDNTYSKKDVYQIRTKSGDSSNIVNAAGTYTLSGDTLRLLGISNGPDLFLKTDSSLIQLAYDGRRITGNLADKYVLNKMK